MALSFNKVILIGRLTKDPELKFATNGTKVCKFSLAVERQAYSKNVEPETDFIPCTAFGNSAEFVSNYMSKGRLILVEGKIQISRWQAQDGTTKYFTDVVVDNVKFMESKKTAQGSDSSHEGYGYSSNKDSDIEMDKRETEFIKSPFGNDDDKTQGESFSNDDRLDPDTVPF